MLKIPQFNKEKHTYEYEGASLKSVSEFKSSFSSFDKERIADMVAKKNNKTVEEVLAEWQELANTAIVRGKKIHDFAEAILNNQEIKPSSIEEESMLDYITGLLKDNEIVMYESPICSLELKLAGTPDLIIKSKLDNTYSIVDYKTNKTLFKKAYNKLLAPFNDLYDIPFNTYSIQLSCYKLMLEEAGYSINKLTIVHFPENSNHVIYDNVIDLTTQIKKHILNNNPDSWMTNH
jgi:predicted RecB family nuclease